MYVLLRIKLDYLNKNKNDKNYAVVNNMKNYGKYYNSYFIYALFLYHAAEYYIRHV